ncbi:MAG: hypothetical protein R6U57_08380 [Anaerolineales bacterium]
MAIKKLIILTIIIPGFLLTGCKASRIQVEKVTPTVQTLHSEILDVRNCETTEDLHQSLYDFQEVQTKIEIHPTATQIGTGNRMEIPKETNSILLHEIKKAYQPELKEAVIALKETKIHVPADKIHMYQIQWLAKTYHATISFSLDGEAYEASYTYRLEIPQIESSRVMSCTA